MTGAVRRPARSTRRQRSSSKSAPTPIAPSEVARAAANPIGRQVVRDGVHPGDRPGAGHTAPALDHARPVRGVHRRLADDGQLRALVLQERQQAACRPRCRRRTPSSGSPSRQCITQVGAPLQRLLQAVDRPHVVRARQPHSHTPPVRGEDPTTRGVSGATDARPRRRAAAQPLAAFRPEARGPAGARLRGREAGRPPFCTQHRAPAANCPCLSRTVRTGPARIHHTVQTFPPMSTPVHAGRRGAARRHPAPGPRAPGARHGARRGCPKGHVYMHMSLRGIVRVPSIGLRSGHG
jgi:hypothetical protein